MEPDDQSPRRSLTQLNVRLPSDHRAALKQLAHDGGVSVNALLGAILASFLSDHTEQVPDPLLATARTIDSTRRSRPHLQQSRLT